MHPFLNVLEQRTLLFDGAMGTLLFARGASSEQCLEELVISRPEWVTEVHQAYAAAGADVIKSHTFGANAIRLADHGLADKVRDLNFKAVKLVRDVREVAGRAIFIAGDIGPLGQRLAPMGQATPEQAAEAFREQILALWEAGADLLLFETFGDLAEIEIGVRAAKEVCDLPVVASMTFAEDGLTLGGSDPATVYTVLSEAGADIVGINCSVGPTQMLSTMEDMHAAAPEGRFLAMPNAGFPERVEGRLSFPSSPEYFGRRVPEFLELGACAVGGCCGTSPMHIRVMRGALDAALAEQNSGTAKPAAVLLMRRRKCRSAARLTTCWRMTAPHRFCAKSVTANLSSA